MARVGYRSPGNAAAIAAIYAGVSRFGPVRRVSSASLAVSSSSSIA
jgi:hypothetical protein